jgi:MoaA/NifB/PqqE/SkfB family radical SAM enzyme
MTLLTLEQAGRDVRFALGVVRHQPFNVLLQVTNRCNMRCSFCDFWPNGVAPEKELTLDDYRRLEEELTRLGTFLISIEGGEPMLRPDLVEIVRIFSRRHLPMLYTNGWFIDAHAAKALYEAGVINVGVSIDYADAARHDRQRDLPGTFDRAWRAVDLLRAHAPHGGRQVHVMTVLMRDNVNELEKLLPMSAAHDVGHCITLLAINGYRRGAQGGEWPAAPVSAKLVVLWRRYPHFRIFREYLDGMDPFLNGESSVRCRAGVQSFNIDHVGNVSPCIEKIDQTAGNIRAESLLTIHRRLKDLDAGRGCQQCWTACRGMSQLFGKGGSWQAWWDMTTRMKST